MGVVALGAIGLAGGIFAGVMGSQQASADRKAQISSIHYQNMIRGMEVDRENIQKTVQWGARLKQAKLAALASGSKAGQKKFFTREALRNQVSQLGNQTFKLNEAVISRVSGKGIGLSSGTAKAIMRQNINKSSESNDALMTNFRRQMQAIDQELTGSISAAQFLSPDLADFVAGRTNIPDHSGSIMASSIVSGTLGGISSGIAAKMRGGGSLAPSGGEGEGGDDGQ
jgi:hypothetical protein